MSRCPGSCTDRAIRRKGRRRSPRSPRTPRASARRAADRGAGTDLVRFGARLALTRASAIATDAVNTEGAGALAAALALRPARQARGIDGRNIRGHVGYAAPSTTGASGEVCGLSACASGDANRRRQCPRPRPSCPHFRPRPGRCRPRLGLGKVSAAEATRSGPNRAGRTRCEGGQQRHASIAIPPGFGHPSTTESRRSPRSRRLRRT